MAKIPRIPKALPVFEYIPEQSGLELADVYAEYRRLRKNVLSPRMQRLEKLGMTDTDVYRQMKAMRSASKIGPGDIRKALFSAYKMSMSQRGTVKKEKEVKKQAQTAADTLRSHGYGVSDKDLPRFHTYMKKFSKKFKGQYESAQAAELFQSFVNKGLIHNQKTALEVARHFEFYANHADEVVAARDSFGKGTTLASMRIALGG